jgi:hypothetical protein
VGLVDKRVMQEACPRASDVLRGAAASGTVRSWGTRAFPAILCYSMRYIHFFYEESAVKFKLHFFLLSSSVRTLSANRQEGPSCLSCCTRFGRRSPCLQNAPPCSGPTGPGSLTDARCDSLRKRPTATLLDWRLQVSGPRPQGLKAVRAMPATAFYPCRLTSLPARGAGRSTTICIRPLAIRRSLVPGRPFCPAAAVRPTRLRYGRPDQSSARRCRRFP